jgi:hypothetical protein
MINARTKLQVVPRPLTLNERYEHSTGVVALRGSLDVVSVFDIIQLVCANRQSWIVRLLQQSADASVTIAAGDLVDARWGKLSGPEALVEIMGCDQGFFELSSITGEPIRSLSGNWHVMVLSAVQQLDERCAASRGQLSQVADLSPTAARSRGKSGEHRLTDIPTQATQVNSPNSHALPRCGDLNSGVKAGARQVAAQLIDCGFTAIREGDLDRARQMWEQALAYDPNNRALQFNLRKLGDRGASTE